MGTIKTVNIMWGLPGSGKSHYVKEAIKNFYSIPGKRMHMVFALDYRTSTNAGYEFTSHGILGEHWVNHVERVKMLESHVRYSEKFLDDSKNPEYHVYVDVPCCTYKELKSVIEMLFNYFMKAEQVKVVYWEPDREICLYNDGGRREFTSRVSIKNMPFETPTASGVQQAFMDMLNTSPNVTIQKMYVQRKAEWKHTFNSEIASKGEPILFNGKLTSTGYSLGGTCRDIMGEVSHIIEAEPMGTFDELDNLLERVCPTMTFLQYKKMFKELVSIEDRDAGDYYSDCREAYYEIDLSELYSWLNENNIKITDGSESL